MANIWRSVRQRTEFSPELPYRPRRMELPNRMELSMKRTLILTAVLAAFLTSGGPAFAQGRGDRAGNQDSNDRGRNEQMQGRGQQRGDSNNRGRDERMQRNGRDDQRGHQARQPERRDYQGRAHYDQRGRAHYDQRREGRGAGPQHAFYRGERLPVQYRHRQYVVEDWRGHRLSAPPRGYHWVQTGADYVLVAIATGVILQLLLTN
jgi:Ni/Co efflux regulator RcnB